MRLSLNVNERFEFYMRGGTRRQLQLLRKNGD